jgi:hypothetical protein
MGPDRVSASGVELGSSHSPPPRPALSPFRAYDPVLILLVNAVVIAYMWIVHGGPARIPDQGWLIAVGQLTGLYAALVSLVGIVLISRTPWLERRYGMDRMTHFHRYVGFTAAVLMASHVVSITIGYARDSSISIWDQIVDSALLPNPLPHRTKQLPTSKVSHSRGPSPHSADPKIPRTSTQCQRR